MNICLIRPNFGSYYQITPPLSLGYLSSALKNSGYSQIDLIDSSLYKLNPYQTFNILSQKEYEIVGIQVYTGAQNWSKEFIRLVKESRPNINIIVGGPHITALKELALEYINADFGVIGEGEKAIVDFVRFIQGEINDPRKIDGFMFKNSGGWVSAEKPYSLIENADTNPYPDWDLLQPQNYFKYMEGAMMPLRGNRPAPILTSRGCPYQCTFCSGGVTSRHIMRFRSPENIIKEIKYLVEHYGVNEIFFSDDNLTLNVQRAEELFDLIIKEKIEISWRAPNGIRIDTLTDSLVSKMSQSGGYYVGVGVETGNPEVMIRIKKSLNLNKINESVNLLHKYGIKVSGFFICGLRGETEKEVLDSIHFSLSIHFDRIQVCNFVPFPGSEDFDSIFGSKGGKEYKNNVNKFQEYGTIPKFNGMELKEILKLQRKFLLKFYLRPKIVWQLISNIKFSQIIAILRHPFITKWLSFKKNRYDS